MSLAKVDQDLVHNGDSAIQLLTRSPVSATSKGADDFIYWLRSDPYHSPSTTCSGHHRTSLLAL